MPNRRGILKASALPLAALVVGGWGFGVHAQTQGAHPAPPASASASPSVRSQPPRLDKHAIAYYATVWGIEDPGVKWAESGELIRFSYRILDPEKAKILNDKKLEPKLVDPEKGVELIVPSLENVGALRQSSSPVAGKVYWMAFSNSGRPVKKGDRVNVVIGNFHAVGLIVE